MGVFSSGGVGIDLGSANVTIFLESEGVVLREPSYVLASRDDPDNVLACGRDARQMLGRTPRAAMLVSPVMDGAVGDIEMTTTLLRELSEKAIGRRRALDRTRVVVSMGLGVTRVERAALEEAVKALDARRAALVRSTVAAAVGAGVSIDEPKGVMVVNIGGSTTEVAVLSADGVAASRSVRTGGMALDEAIIRYIRNEKAVSYTHLDVYKRQGLTWWEDAVAEAWLMVRLGFAAPDKSIYHLLVDEAQDYSETALSLRCV